MKRQAALYATAVVFLSVAGVTAEELRISLPVDEKSAYVIPLTAENCALSWVTGDGQSTELRDLVAPPCIGFALISGSADGELLDWSRRYRVLPERILTEDDFLVVKRLNPLPVPFLMANLTSAPMVVDVTGESGRATTSLPAKRIVEIPDLFAGLHPDERIVVVRSSTPGAQYLSSLSQLRLVPVAAVGRRRIAVPRRTADCESLEAAYKSLLKEITEFAKTPIAVPSPPKVDYGCKAPGAMQEYADAVTAPEEARIEAMMVISREVGLMGCPFQVDAGAMFDRLAKKSSVLLKTDGGPETHPALIMAMLRIDHVRSRAGYPAVGTVETAVEKWLPADIDHYLKKVKEEHDYEAAAAAIKVFKELALVTSKTPNLEMLIKKLNDALRFRFRLGFETITTIEDTDVVIKMKAEGEAVLETLAHSSGSTVTITMQPQVGTLTSETLNCRYPGEPFPVVANVILNPCADPAVKVRLQGPFGGPIVQDCDADEESFAIPSADFMQWMMAVALSGVYGIYLEQIELDDKKLPAPKLINRSVVAVDDARAKSGSWEDWSSHALITTTMTHEPK